MAHLLIADRLSNRVVLTRTEWAIIDLEYYITYCLLDNYFNFADAASAPRERVELAGLAAGVVAKLAAIGERRGVSVAFAGGSDGAVRGDRAALERALVNVVENAIVYTPAGGSVRVELGRAGSRLELRTLDTGIGIAAADLPHVTEPFFRADRARTANEGGTGLGLSIAARIVRDHQGAIQVASEPGRGTTVTMRFPAA